MNRRRAVQILVLLMGSLAIAAAQAPAPPATGTGAISGVVTDGVTKQPIADAIVELGFPQQRDYPEFSRPLFTDERGRFVFTGLTAGSAFVVRARKPGYMETGAISPSGSDTTPPIALEQGQWFSSASIVLWPPASISGTVRDESGEPVIGVFVKLLAQVRIGASLRWASGNIVLTDDRGMFRIGRLPHRSRASSMCSPPVEARGRGRRTTPNPPGRTTICLQSQVFCRVPTCSTKIAAPGCSRRWSQPVATTPMPRLN